MRVMLADDSLLFREGLARLLAEAGFDIAGLAADGEGLIALVDADPPDVAVVDIRMPPTRTDEGLAVARRRYYGRRTERRGQPGGRALRVQVEPRR